MLRVRGPDHRRPLAAALLSRLRSPWISTAAVLAVLLPLYLSTANWTQAQISDTQAVFIPAHQLAQEGTLVVPERPVDNPWFVAVDGGFLSNRFPGTILHAVPSYWVFGRPGTPDPAPGAAAAALIAGLAMAALHLLFRRLTDPSTATVAAIIAGTATSTWGISAAAMWTHGPGQLWLILALLGISSVRYLPAGLAFAVAVTVRPQNAVVAAAVGLHRSWQTRRWRPALLVGLMSSLGAVAVLAYNRLMFVVPEAQRADPLAGGYGSGPVRRLLNVDLGDWMTSLVGMLASPSRGALFASPFLLVLLLEGARRAWRVSPGWVKSAALGGLAYLLVQSRANGFDGGAAFLVYRLPLEAMTMAAPLLLLSYREGIAGRRLVAPFFWAATVFSVCVQATAAIHWDAAYQIPEHPPDFGFLEWRWAMEQAGPGWVAACSVVTIGAFLAARHRATASRSPAEIGPRRAELVTDPRPREEPLT